jgi:hypothetical protein
VVSFAAHIVPSYQPSLLEDCVKKQHQAHSDPVALLPSLQPGHQRFTVGMQDITATLDSDGCIRYNGTRISSISKFALVVLRERNPARQVGRLGQSKDSHCAAAPRQQI